MLVDQKLDTTNLTILAKGNLALSLSTMNEYSDIILFTYAAMSDVGGHRCAFFLQAGKDRVLPKNQRKTAMFFEDAF